MAVFAAIYMIPMLYRFTQSSHPRSGIIGCLSFTVVSLSTYTANGQPSVLTIAWTRGLAFIVGVVAALTINWVLWPFVARHELRKSLSSMILHSAILYRGVIAKYIYYAQGQEPTQKDIARSEMLEGRLREGFVRMRQLMELTRHEMRLRAPFDPLPYSALISACESFFEHLVQVRQSSLYFQPGMLASDPDVIARLNVPRRDAVAVILLNLYILACALRADRPVPRYLPSAAAARRKLIDCMDAVEREGARRADEHGQERVNPADTDEVNPNSKGKQRRDTHSTEEPNENNMGSNNNNDHNNETVIKASNSNSNSNNNNNNNNSSKRRWADVYRYAFSTALTDIVENLQEMQRFTKEVCGEVGWEVVAE